MKIKSSYSDEEKIILEAVGMRLKSIREKFGLSLTKLCKISKIDRNSYSKVN